MTKINKTSKNNSVISFDSSLSSDSAFLVRAHNSELELLKLKDTLKSNEEILTESVKAGNFKTSVAYALNAFWNDGIIPSNKKGNKVVCLSHLAKTVKDREGTEMYNAWVVVNRINSKTAHAKKKNNPLQVELQKCFNQFRKEPNDENNECLVNAMAKFAAGKN